jgi:CMP-N,N'-diacetyllegionaminic acid synthase
MTTAGQPRAVAVIHARGGSKRIPLKNLRELNGKPLIAYPIELCRGCEWIERIVVSTDHDGIMEAALRFGAEVPFRRPADISEDVASELVTDHALRFLLDADGVLPDLAVTLTPATPLTRSSRLDEAYAKLRAHPEWDCVTSVRSAAEHPEWMLVIDPSTGEARTLLGNPLDGEYNVSQNLRAVHYPAGAFWINRTSSFLRRPSLYGDRWGAVVLDGDEAVDIDYPDDLRRAELLTHGIARKEVNL